MGTLTFVDQVTTITTDWLNEADALIFDVFGGAASVGAAKTALSLVPGTDVQAYDAGLLSIAGLTTAANKMIYTTALDTYAVADLTAAGRALLDDATAAAQRTTLGLVIGTDVQAYDATILNAADIGVSVQAYNATYLVDADIGVNVQAYDATILVDADIGTTVQAYNATYLVDADIGVTVEAYAGFTAPILDKAAPGNIGATTPGTGKFSTLESVDDLTIDADASGSGSVFGNATGGAKGAGTINAGGIYVNGAALTGGFRGALAYRTTSQTITNATVTALSCDAESYDTDTIHDNATNPSRLTVPAGVTKVRLSGAVRWVANSTGYRNVYIVKNGSTFTGTGVSRIDAVSASVTVELNVTSSIVTVTGGDYFELNVYQTSGGSLDLSGTFDNWFAMEIIA